MSQDPAANERTAAQARNHSGWIAGLILAFTVLAYLPVLRNGFIWDDDAHLTQNPCIVGPLGLKDIWTSRAARICPLVQTTFWVEHKIWGFHPFPYHLVNVLMHALAALVLWRALQCLKVRGAWFGAALWALHPVQVESAAWVTEMKNTQSGLFFLLAILFFCKSKWEEQIPGSKRTNTHYAISLVCGALAMASKSSTVVLPVVLGLCAWWIEKGWRWKNLPRLAPFFVMSALAGALSVWTQRLEGATGADYARSWPERIATAGKVVWFYLGKLAWPHPLIFIYPRWKIDAANPVSYLPVLALVLVFFVLWRNRHGWGRPAFMAGAYFVVALSPVLGLVNHYFLRYSFVGDHFQYLASMGALAFAGGAIIAGLQTLLKDRWLSCGICGLTLLVLGSISWQRTFVFHDDETLWRDTLAKDPASCIAHNNLGEILRHQGKLKEALAHFRESVRINPNNAGAWNNLGVVLGNQGLVSEASESYRHALRINPDDSDALANLASVLAGGKNYAEALPLFEKALRLKPWDVAIHISYGDALMEVGRQEEAAVQFETALRYDPANARAHEDLIKLQVSQGKTAEAMEHYREVLRQSPHDAVAHYSLGLLLAASGRSAEAEEEYREALRDQPDHAEAHMELGNLLMQEGDKTNAMTHWREAIRVKPYLPPALNSLAWVLATDKDSGLRDGAEAVRLGERAALATGNKSPGVLDTLAAAYAEAGRFTDAVATAQKALDLAAGSGKENLVNQIREHLDSYKAGRPWRE